MTTNLDFESTARRARKMTLEALAWSAADAWEAARASEEMEAAGYCRGKGSGYYRDEASIYRAEIRRRAEK